MSNDPQATWTEYNARIRNRRIAEARILHQKMTEAGVNSETILALDFQHFGNSEDGVRQLANQLSENYNMVVTPKEDAEYWNAEGTTRPDGIEAMDETQCTEWVLSLIHI